MSAAVRDLLGLRDCPECGAPNDLFVNPDRCRKCRQEWGDE